MNVKELIDTLSKEVKEEDRENARIEFWYGEKEYAIRSMEGYNYSPDIMIHLKKVNTPVIKPMVFKKEHTEMVKKKVKEIKKSL